MKGLMNTNNTSFRYDKEMLFKEFADAKAKDTKLGKGDDNKVHTNRIALLKEYIKLEAEMPVVFSDVNINFNRLLTAYQSENPRDHFYKSVFGKTFEQVQAEREADDWNESAELKGIQI